MVIGRRDTENPNDQVIQKLREVLVEYAISTFQNHTATSNIGSAEDPDRLATVRLMWPLPEEQSEQRPSPLALAARATAGQGRSRRGSRRSTGRGPATRRLPRSRAPRASLDGRACDSPQQAGVLA